MTMIANVGPLEEGQIGPWTSQLIAIKEVIGRNIVLIHRLLHEPHAKHLSIKRDVAGCVPTDSRYMVEAT